MALLLEKAEALNSESWIYNSTSSFKPKVFFQIETRNHIIETIKSPYELRSILDLRAHSFLGDFLSDEPVDWVDFDRYDLLADHIIVKEKKTGLIIGTYRIICSEFSNDFYSEEEFDLSSLLSEPGIKMELGRACIHKDHRNGIILSLIWKGISHYANLTRSKHLFGCTSVKTTSPRVSQSIYWNLYPFHYSQDLLIPVNQKYKFPYNIEPSDILPWDIVEAHVPPLLKSYIKAGAKICSAPALDTVFKCVDYFTVLNLSEVSPKYKDKYFSSSTHL